MLLSLGSSCQDVWSGFLQNGCFWRKATILKKSNPFLRSPALTTMIWRIFALCPALPLFQRSVRKLSSLSSSVIYPPIIYSFYFNLPTDWSTTLRQPYWKWPSALPWPWKRICSYSAWSISCLWYNWYIILLQRLEHVTGIHDTDLHWLSAYLTNRTQL